MHCELYIIILRFYYFYRMMKKLIIILLFALPIFCNAQGTFELSGYGRIGMDIRSNTTYNTGLAFEWRPTNGNLGLNYSLRFGEDFDNNFTFQCPLGLITGLLAAAWLDDIDSPGLGFLLAFIPEGLSYNVYMTDGVFLEPYINPLLLNFYSRHVGMSIELGTKMKAYIKNKFFGALDLAVQSPYDAANINTYAGISLGFVF